MYRPFRLLGTKNIESLQVKLNELLSMWASDWFDSNVSLTMAVLDKESIESITINEFDVYLKDTNSWCVLLNSKSISQDWGGIFFNKSDRVGTDKSILGPEIAGLSLEDLIKRIAGKGLVHLDRVDANSYATIISNPSYVGLQTTLVRVDIKNIFFYFIPSPEIISRYLEFDDTNISDINSKNKLVSFNDGLSSQKITGEVKIGSTELSLNELLNLRVGDVVRLDQKVTDLPGLLINNVVITGFLGRSGNYKSLKINSVKSDK